MGIEEITVLQSCFTDKRIEIEPCDVNASIKLIENGYFLADRTVETNIDLRKYDTSISPRIHCIDDIYSDEIFELSCAAFKYDRRFHLSRNFDDNVAKENIYTYLQLAKENNFSFLSIVYKEQKVAYCVLKPYINNSYFVFLAAVMPKYWGTGIAISLYQGIIDKVISLNSNKVVGRISCANTSVMNVYASFGAKFSNALDVYIKDGR